jgi:hypothetical protein
MASFVSKRLVAGWRSPGIDMASVDANRNGRLDVGDLVTFYGAPGPAADPATNFILGPGNASGGAGSVTWVPILVSPKQTAAAFSVEVQYDPDQLTLVGVQKGPALGWNRPLLGEPEPGRAVVVGVTNPPAPLGNATTLAWLLVRPRTGLPVATRIPLAATEGAVADAAGNLKPLVTLRSGVLTLTTSSRNWELYR